MSEHSGKRYDPPLPEDWEEWSRGQRKNWKSHVRREGKERQREGRREAELQTLRAGRSALERAEMRLEEREQGLEEREEALEVDRDEREEALRDERGEVQRWREWMEEEEEEAQVVAGLVGSAGVESDVDMGGGSDDGRDTLREAQRKREAAMAEREAMWDMVLAGMNPTARMKAVILSRDGQLWDDWVGLEVQRGATIDPQAEDFAGIRGRLRYLSEPGTYIGVEFETNQVVLAVRIQAWDDMSGGEREWIGDLLGVICRLHLAHRPITTNAATRHPHRTPAQLADGRLMEHGCGVLTSHGWRTGTMRERAAGQVVAVAAPRQGIDIEQYVRDSERLGDVDHLYQHRMSTLLGEASRCMSRIAMRAALPSFSVLELPGEPAGRLERRPFGNLLAVSHDFSNYGHTDADESDGEPVLVYPPAHDLPASAAVEDEPEVGSSWAYGLWAVASRMEGEWKFAGKADHVECKGGYFVWPAWALAIEFDRARGLVDGVWRGRKDPHCTVQPVIREDVFRMGSSLQITHAFAEAWEAYVEKGVVAAAVTHADRVENLYRFEERRSMQ